MRNVGLALCVTVTMCCSGADTHAQSVDNYSPGFSLGIAYTPDDQVTGIGWTAAGSLERLVGNVCELRARVGVIGLEGDIQGQQPNATYGFLTADVLAADLVSPTGGIGLYHVDLQAPLVDDDQSSFQFGVNAGVRVFIPYSHEHAFTIDGTVHRVFGDGPSILITFGAGLVF